MIPVILGFDPQLTRLGWAAVAVGDGRVLAAGCEPLDIKDGGWLHQQVRRAVRRTVEHVAGMLFWDDDELEVVILAREEPVVHFARAAKYAGMAIALLEAECHEMWDHLDRMLPLNPNEWKSACGLPGNASKDVVMEWATDLYPLLAGIPVKLRQDAADAIGVARAAYETMEVTP